MILNFKHACIDLSYYTSGEICFSLAKAKLKQFRTKPEVILKISNTFLKYCNVRKFSIKIENSYLCNPLKV